MGSFPASWNLLTFIAYANKEWGKNATEPMRLVIFLANELQQEKAKTCGLLSDPVTEVALSVVCERRGDNPFSSLPVLRMYRRLLLQ